MRFFQRQISAQEQYDKLLQRFKGKYLILHHGFPEEWLEALMKQPGGAGYFRLDARKLSQPRPAPIEWLSQNYLLPLDLPPVLFVRIDEGQCLVRHLTVDGTQWVDSSDLLWFIDELDQRHHVKLVWNGDGFDRQNGIDVYDNVAEAMFDAITDLPPQ